MSFKLLVLTASIIAYIGITLKNSDLNCNYIELAPTPEFTDNLAPNTKLQTATFLAKGKVIGPETIEISKDGIIYTGLSNGEVVSVDLNGNVKKITLIGNTTDKTLCHFENGLRFAEPQCGRPLGMRLRGNFLYIADGFYGLVKVDVTTGDKKIILSSDDSRFGDKPLKCANDLDIDDDGVIYFIDSSYKRTLNEFLQEYIEAQPRGRLFSFNEMTNELNLLHTGLFYPNGIQLTPAKDAVLINEDTMARILKYQLVGYDKGKVGVFADLPGFGDNIRLSPSGKTLIVPFALARNSYKNSILDVFGRFPRVRNFIGSVIDPITAFKYSAKYGLIVEYDLNGNILRSWHDPSGKVIDSTSTAFLYGDKFYLGSFYKEYIGVVDY